jgi:glycogen synthase
MFLIISKAPGASKLEWRTSMNILIATPFFHPSVGGVETVTDTIAQAFVAAGHDVTVTTKTPKPDAEPRRCYDLVRQPSPLQLMRLVRKCDIFMHNEISLPMSWPLLFYRRPWVVVRHTASAEARTVSKRAIGIAKRLLGRFATSVAVSRFIADHYQENSLVIPNPLPIGIFDSDGEAQRDRDVVFVGRLSAEKGAHILLQSIAELAKSGYLLKVSIVGEGLERPSLQLQRDRLGLCESVAFIGALHGPVLAATIRRHRVLAIPSVCPESFGLVALEGLACGCAVVASDIGGLPEAVGSVGVLVPAGDVRSLASGLYGALNGGVPSDETLEARRLHLAAHSCDRIAKEYLRLFARIKA